MSWRKREEVELMIMGVGQVEKGHYERERERESEGKCLKEISISLFLVIKKLDFAIWSEIRSC